MSTQRPAAICVAAGLLVVTAGTAGLLVARQSTPAMRPPPRGVGTVAVPSGPVVAAPDNTVPTSAESPIARSGPAAVSAGSLQPPAPAPVARPVALTIPLIGVRTQLITLGLAADGTMQVPSSTAVAGWYTGSPRPGAMGPAIIVGHIDSVSGPGVFFRLSELRPGDRIYVTRADGSLAEFRVTAVQIYLKTAFPVQAVYGETPDPELRLVTCGGTFDAATGHYLSNTIVYASQQG
jgi:sortase (surface protein transpeptidase)